MKKQRLLADFEFDFDVYGIVSSFKDYKLAWNINRVLNVDLRKEEDISIQFVDSELIVSHFKFATDNSELQLLRNKSFVLSAGESQYLIPELPRMDYFILMQGDIGGTNQKVIIDKLMKTPGIEFVTRLDTESLKSRENFIF